MIHESRPLFLPRWKKTSYFTEVDIINRTTLQLNSLRGRRKRGGWRGREIGEGEKGGTLAIRTGLFA